ncbi:MAG: HNH endonuclease [Planctomycetota bacterium]
MNEATREFVRVRAHHRCEYCQLGQEDSPLAALHVEHVIPIKHDGSDDVSNLALACIDCNLCKGPNLTGFDPETGELCRLFHPREQEWEDHFRWLGIYIVGKTDVGRTTIKVLNMNSSERLELRMTE